MKKILITAVVLVLGVGAVAYAMSELKEPKTYSWRYKMTVEIDTPEGVKTGSAVREVTIIKYPPETEGESLRIETKVKGEAVIVDLGERGKLFALLKGGTPVPHDLHAKHISQKLFPNPPSVNLVDYYKSNIEQLKSVQREVPDKHHPLMVTFEDMSNPRSIMIARAVMQIQESSPAHPKYVIEDNLEELFGKGVAFNDVSIELTDEDITSGILTYIPDYVASKEEFMEWFKKLKYGDLKRVGPYDFYQGGYNE